MATLSERLKALHSQIGSLLTFAQQAVILEASEALKDSSPEQYEPFPDLTEVHDHVEGLDQG